MLVIEIIEHTEEMIKSALIACNRHLQLNFFSSLKPLPHQRSFSMSEFDKVDKVQRNNEKIREAIFLPTFCFMSLLKTAWSDGIQLLF